MDSWPQDRQRQKRTFDEMSQHASLSPSPFLFGNPAPSIPLDNPPNLFERRRTSHPHNEASRSSYLSPDRMAEPRGLLRPTHEHHISQTIIDLTDDTAEPSTMGMNTRFLPRPPQLGRSDALGLEDIIDLTDDVVDDELEIIDTRTVRDPQPAPQGLNSHRRLPHPNRTLRALPFNPESSPLFLPQDARDPHIHHLGQDMLSGGPFAAMAGRFANLIPQVWTPDERYSLLILGPGQHAQRMPDLDYNQVPFGRAPRNQPKPQHQPPPDAKPGFTRSPTEEDVVICPACLNELVANKTEDEPPIKKPTGRAQTKKDREEHPFWVIKECGHVYCNRCYQSRRPDKKKPNIFPEASNATGKTIPICAVEGCNKDIGEKKHWVGVFI